MKTYSLFFLLLTLASCSNSNKEEVTATAEKTSEKTFTNPLLPSGPDPWSIYVDGYYYYTHTLQDSLVIWKTNNLEELKSAEKFTAFVPPRGTDYSHQLWAPEIHLLDGVWYMYFAADDGDNNNHRMFVIRNQNQDPMTANWEFLGEIKGMSEHWAIDASIFEHRGQRYMAWSGWEGDENGQQDIYLAKMENPWTVVGERVKISSPTHEWERHGKLGNPGNPDFVYVNEGPQILKNQGNLYLIFSASGCWTDNYSLGMLSIPGDADLMNPENWTKHPEPVFTQSAENEVYASGHNSFFKSPDGTEDWILYHANDEPGQGCGSHRSPRAQKFTWNEDGTPNFGKPHKTGIPEDIPAE